MLIYIGSLLVLVLIGFITFPLLIEELGGSFDGEPNELQTGLSAEAQSLVKLAFDGLIPEKQMDYHVHVLGLGNDNNGTFVNAHLQSWRYPFKKIKFLIYSSAARINHSEKADHEFITRLVQLIRNIPRPGKYHLLAFDKFYDLNGKSHLDKTEFYVPNTYVVQLAQKFPDIFLPTISIHPYRLDALDRLDKWGREGVRFIKWLPNAMGIDPSHEKTTAFYKKMKEYDMILLTHTGEEQAVEAEAYQKLGNPLLFRKPLEQGVRVVMAHVASLGECADLDDKERREVSCFDLFMRMMDDSKYNHLLYGEISALILFNRSPQVIQALIDRQDLHHRLINGSDYPLPAVNFVIHTSSLEKHQFITDQERQLLNEIYKYNPLLFDFVVKRTIKSPRTQNQFSPTIFMENPRLR